MSGNDGSELHSLFTESLVNENIFTIGTTVDTGFEWEAVDECKEKLNKNVRVVRERGKIYFNVPWDQFSKVQEMRSIDNIFIVADVSSFAFSGTDKESDLELFKDAVHNKIKLESCLNAWRQITGFQGKIYPSVTEFKAEEEGHKLANKTVESVTCRGRKRGQDPADAKETDILKFRVTCERSGKHTFDSPDIARTVGGELQEKYHWLVDLSAYHLEVVCKLTENEFVTQLRVTLESKHRRNITCFGPTTLRATVCYNLLRLAHPKPGDIIIDPMCGGGSIPIEGALAYSNSYVLCGDNHPKAVDRTKSNIDVAAAKCKIDSMQWSVTGLPLMDSSVDVVVTDMPFGKRSGRMCDNRVLYKQFLLELGRVVRSSGRMVLLTYDRRSFSLALQAAGNLFRVIKTVGANIGGLHAAVYVLKRTTVAYEQLKPKLPSKHFNNNKTTETKPSTDLDS